MIMNYENYENKWKEYMYSIEDLRQIEELEEKLLKEMNNAYTFAHENKITTMNTIEKADMNGPLTRVAMAKMLSYYAINVLKKEPDLNRVNKFKDISDELDAQYDNGVTLAYQL